MVSTMGSDGGKRDAFAVSESGIGFDEFESSMGG
jgi:hypothetical protein